MLMSHSEGGSWNEAEARELGWDVGIGEGLDSLGIVPVAEAGAMNIEGINNRNAERGFRPGEV